jgi:hypothetical protein
MNKNNNEEFLHTIIEELNKDFLNYQKSEEILLQVFDKCAKFLR